MENLKYGGVWDRKLKYDDPYKKKKKMKYHNKSVLY